MKEFFNELFKIPSTKALAILSAYSVSLTLARVFYTGHSMFLFMVWNLFLAAVPWFVASFINIRKVRNLWALAALVLCWLAFFPNALYVLTDLVHLGQEGSAPLWFDLILLLSYGITGLLFGFTSLYLIERRIQQLLPQRRIIWLAFGLLYVSCFGVYLGRFLRWNSWDLLTNPGQILGDSLDRLFNPLDHQASWAFTLLFGSLLAILYWSFHALACHSKVDQSAK